MPTAYELGRAGWQPYIQAHGRRRRKKKPLDKDRNQFIKKAHTVAKRLKTELRAKRVILFGSVAHGHWFDQDSDIDIAVEGLTGEQYWEAWRIAEEIINDRQVEIVDIETAGEALLNSIETNGIHL